jgi:hypothetical protein
MRTDVGNGDLVPPCFHTALRVEKVGAYDWKVLEPLIFESKRIRGFFVLPAGAVIDFASTPRFLWWWLPKSGQYDYGTALHDGGYRGLLQTRDGRRIRLTREFSDLLMDEANEAAGVGSKTRAVLLRGVQWFGGGAYKGVPNA